MKLPLHALLLVCLLLRMLFLSGLEASVLSDDTSYELSINGPYVEVLLKTPSESLEIIEYTEGLSTWAPIARNYGQGWENTQPNAYAIYNAASNNAGMDVPVSNKGFFRKLSVSSTATPSNKSLAARFLMQSTFGPTLLTIDAFPNVDYANFLDASYSNFELWIDQQSQIAPFYHRAYFRQRSDPDYTDTSTMTIGGIDTFSNEVGHDPSLGHRLTFFRDNIANKTNWECRLPGLGGIYDANGQLIDYTLYTEDVNDNGILDPGEDIGYTGSGQSAVGNGQIDHNLSGLGTAGKPYIPRIGGHVDNALAAGFSKWDISLGQNKTKKVIWYEAALNAEDQLRQRIAWALSQYFVVGELGSNNPGTTERWTNYYDIFVRNAFGNFYDILSEVTWSPHMGYYLSHMGNQKADPAKGTFPDENFAREVMQLFTIGLWELNEDGTLVLDSNGDAIPTYDNDDITEFAKVFTGLNRPTDRANLEYFFGNYIDPMKIQSWKHDFSTKTLLDGSTLGPFNSNQNGVRDDIEGLLTHLFNHSNMPPFFAKFLIQRFTISNPSPAYIQAVSEAFKTGLFNNQGTGNRGDILATIKAVLLHPEAREAALSFDPNHGKLREPIIRLMHLARAFKVQSIRTYGWHNFNKLEDIILQAPYGSASVFNFYRPDYSPNGVIADQALTAPEFQINNDVSALQLFNAYYTLINFGIAGGFYGNVGEKNYIEAPSDLSDQIILASDAQVLLEHLDLLMTGGKLSDASKSVILGSINSAGSGEALVKHMAYLISITQEYNTLY